MSEINIWFYYLKEKIFIQNSIIKSLQKWSKICVNTSALLCVHTVKPMDARMIDWARCFCCRGVFVQNWKVLLSARKSPQTCLLVEIRRLSCYYQRTMHNDKISIRNGCRHSFSVWLCIILMAIYFGHFFFGHNSGSVSSNSSQTLRSK